MSCRVVTPGIRPLGRLCRLEASPGLVRTDQKNVKIMGAHTERRLMADHSMVVCDTSSALAAESTPVSQPHIGDVRTMSQEQQVACATSIGTVQR